VQRRHCVNPVAFFLARIARLRIRRSELATATAGRRKQSSSLSVLGVGQLTGLLNLQVVWRWMCDR